MDRRLAAIALISCIAAAWLAADLTIVHYRVTFGEPGGGACGALGGCAPVVASRWGRWLGLPVSLWGLWYALAAASLAAGVLLGARDAVARARALLWLTLAALAADAALAWIAWTRLGRFCPLCVASYATHVVIFAAAALLLRGAGVSWRGAPPRLGFAGDDPRAGTAAAMPAIAVALAVLATLAALAVSARSRAAERENREGLLAHLRTAEPASLPDDRPPTHGSPRAPVTLVVFTDLLCEQCAALERHLEVLEASHGDSLRVVHRHFPMDASCNPRRARTNPHPGACALAHAAECATRLGAGERFRAVALAGGTPSPDRVEEYAARAGLDRVAFRACLRDPESLEAVRRDVTLGDSLGITATPTTFVNGRAVVGRFEPWLWEEMIALVRAADAKRR